MANEENAKEMTITEAEATPTEVVATAAPAPVMEGERRREWNPKTELGKKILHGEITSMNMIFDKGLTILESGIVDYLLPNLENDIILIGGSPGKGGGARRTPGRKTARMHKSGRRFHTSCLAVCGNKDGFVGYGLAKAIEFRSAATKALNEAKLSIMPIMRGCGSWQCACASPHSIPAIAEGKAGSVRVTLLPAPKGVGMTVSDEIKKIMMLAGIKDVWIKSRGSTDSRVNHVKAVFNAFEKLNRMKIPEIVKQKSGVVVG